MEPANDETMNQAEGSEDSGSARSAEGARDAQVDRAEVEKLREERDYYLDQVQRTRAELENYRKRVSRDREQLTRRITVDVFRDVLPILDDLRLALQSTHEGGSGATLLDGLRMISSKFDQLLLRYQIEAVEAVGKTFDPNLHEAMFHEESSEVAEGAVLAEFEKGYRLGDDLIRPARVKVAKAPSTSD
ncbi:MAG: nucleotide exchange factor GrpE [Planctomycetota bacterium]